MTKKIYYFFLVILFLSFGCNKDDGDKNTGKGEECSWNSNPESIFHGGENREYVLYVPDSYDGSTPVPLMMNFHGFGGSAGDYMLDADMRGLAESEVFILVYPQGSCLDGTSHWNPALPGGDNKSDADDLGFIEAMITDLSNRYAIDMERVYACGYSNGGMLAYGLACFQSDWIAAIGAVSGTMLDTGCVPSHPIPLINIHGTTDGVLPYNGSSEYNSVEQTLNFWIDFNHTDATPIIHNLNSGNIEVEHFVYENGDSMTSVEHYKIVNGEHVWFDLDINGSNTDRLIWDFVSKYDIHGLR